MAYDHAIHVELEVDAVSGGRPRRTGPRKFVVHYDEDGEPLRIKEIVQQHRPAGLRETSYWSPKSHPRVGLAVKILHAASMKRMREDRAASATP